MVINEYILLMDLKPYKWLSDNYQCLSIEVMHKAWHDASAVKVGHFEWLTMYTGVTGQKRTKPVSLKQATIP